MSPPVEVEVTTVVSRTTRAMSLESLNTLKIGPADSPAYSAPHGSR